MGDLFLAASANGLCLLDWSDRPVVRRRLGEIDRVKDEPVSEFGAAVDAYFRGDLFALSEIAVDLSLLKSQFRRDVLAELRTLSPASLTTYGTLAAAVERSGAAQAVGGAVGANPVPIIIPCHRVVAADGSLGGFSGGLSRKRFLLAHEGFADLPGGWTKGNGLGIEAQMTFDV